MSDKDIMLLEEVLKKLNSGGALKDYTNTENYKILRDLGLISIKPYIIVCNVDEATLKEGNEHTKNIIKSYPEEKVISIFCFLNLFSRCLNLQVYLCNCFLQILY